MNQNPEQLARDKIDSALLQSGWLVQSYKQKNIAAGLGVAIREYSTDTGPADYILFINKKPVGVIEAKREEEGVRLIMHESQTENYANAKLKYLNNEPLLFLYESTGEITRFTDYRDPKPRSREVYSFHRPETFTEWLRQGKSLRARLFDLPLLPEDGLRECQIKAINNLDESLKNNHPRALLQMATGSGKTFTAITAIYRLLKYAKAKRVLFLVDTKNLGEQAEQEFMAYLPNDDNRKFVELYNVQRLKSSYIATDSQVCISTIQRVYSILKGTELEESAEEENPNERSWQKKEAIPIQYNKKLPIEFFDLIVIDECHRSIYNLWRQVIEYFDAFLIGLTATPDNRTIGFFKENIVSEYTHDQAVLDNVNVGYDVYLIETDVSNKGGVIWKGEFVDRRERLTRKKRWEMVDEEVVYTSKKLDEEVVNPSQIRLILRTFKEHLPQMFTDRYDEHGNFEVPKTLIFAKSDSHADDIINIAREEFAEQNKFCKKITYRVADAKGTLQNFRNEYYPRIAVTVDMIATGTDVKPLECLLFMRDVRSANYFEQMKGRGTRTIDLDSLRKVTPTAKNTKDHFVIVDAIGATKSIKITTRTLEKKPGTPLKDLLGAIAVGNRDEDLFSSLANRLTRLEKQVTQKEKELLVQKANGHSIGEIAKGLLYAYDPDRLHEIRTNINEANPDLPPTQLDSLFKIQHTKILDDAAVVFTGELNVFIENVRRAHEQFIDDINRDTLVNAGWDADIARKASVLIRDFTEWLQLHKEEILALQIFYDQPQRRREITYKMIRDLVEQLKLDKPLLAPLHVWRAYEQLEKVNGQPKNELIALVSLVRKVTGADTTLTGFDKTVDNYFQDWIFKKQAGPLKYTEEQVQWLRMIKDYIANSFHVDKEAFEYTPFNALGGLGKFYQLFKEDYEIILDELNTELVA